MKYRYFSTMRPVSIGTYPNNGNVVEIHNFDSREMVKSIGREAWGYLETLTYDPETEIVTGTYQNGGKVRINVACDSGVSMIRDIMAKM